MLTRLRVRNFKRFDDVDIELGETVVLIGPNDSGKTTALQALALWEIGVRRWLDKRRDKASPEKRPGVAINRRDLISIPVPDANLLWRDRHVRDVESIEKPGKRSTKTQNVRIDVIVDGVTEGRTWSCGLEFDYANEESFYCRPLRLEQRSTERMPLPLEAGKVRVAYLPPMSGLAAVEPKWEPGRVNVLIGEGQTAQVLRNLCYQICSQQPAQPGWDALVGHIRQSFGVDLLPPRFDTDRGEVTMAYTGPHGVHLDLSSSGRGLQQTLLLLAHLYANPGTVLLLDEPDAHLEILRQRQTYALLTDVAARQRSQVIAASHSEVVLNEAADRDVVVAFVGKPHRLNDRGSQVLKALREIGFDQYYQAEQTGWVLYLESASDLAMLQAFARTLDHPARQLLERPFVHYVATNLPQHARDHFYGLREAKPDLLGVALFDRLDKELQSGAPLAELMWERREIENYFCSPDVLLAYAQQGVADDLFGASERDQRVRAMQEAIRDVSDALSTLGKPAPWSPDLKVSDEFLEPVLKKFFGTLNLPLSVRKSDYHVLASLVPRDSIDSEVVRKLDRIVAVAAQAQPKLV
ncbi:MAG TPA: AAA family ATPase [Phycisphaerae bacterium]|nr:AAA family ATPase [Phycisphaerae bacterium]HNU43932.1 AAA family ATPase [Phycisphaerae bacterium]